MQPDSCPLGLFLSLLPVLERAGVSFLALLSERAGMFHVAAPLGAAAGAGAMQLTSPAGISPHLFSKPPLPCGRGHARGRG